MYYLRTLHLENFRNHQQLHAAFSAHFNCIVGKNGIGKSNLLDAIHYACFAKSALNIKDKDIIQHNANYFRLEAGFACEDKKEIVQLWVSRTGKKEITCNHAKVVRRVDFVGRFPVMMLSPQDEELVRGGDQYRRKLFDAILSQEDKTYCTQWLTYYAHLKRRNALLKKHYLRHDDHELLDLYDEQLITLAVGIAKKRANYMQALLPHYRQQYQRLVKQEEAVGIAYGSEALSEQWPQLFRRARKNDILQKTTRHGIHRDSFELFIEGKSAKTYGSQGQKKTLLFALKLAIIAKDPQRRMILLLDDVLDKLDEERRQHLFGTLAKQSLGQVFMAGTEQDKMKKYLTKYAIAHKFFFLQEGGGLVTECPTK